MRYPHHPAASVWEMMSQTELEGLADSIRRLGLEHPIVLFEGQIIDGRNRDAACAMAGVEPTYTTKDECASPAMYVLEVHERRRHPSRDQRAMAAARAESLFKKEAAERQREHGGTAPGRPKNTSPHAEGKCLDHTDKHANEALNQAAKAAGAGRHTARRAKKVLAEALAKSPEVEAKVARGEITLGQAEEELGLPPSIVGKHNGQREKIRELCKTGLSNEEIALRLGLKTDAVMKTRSKMGLSLPREMSNCISRSRKAQSKVAGMAETVATVSDTWESYVQRWGELSNGATQEQLNALALALREARTNCTHLIACAEGRFQ